MLFLVLCAKFHAFIINGNNCRLSSRTMSADADIARVLVVVPEGYLI
jgi:hypothetical protein